MLSIDHNVAFVFINSVDHTFGNIVKQDNLKCGQFVLLSLTQTWWSAGSKDICPKSRNDYLSSSRGYISLHLNTSRNMSQNVSRNVIRNNHLHVSSSRGYTYITSEYEWSLDRKTPEWLVASPAGWPQLSTKSTLIWWFWWWYRWSWSRMVSCLDGMAFIHTFQLL